MIDISEKKRQNANLNIRINSDLLISVKKICKDNNLTLTDFVIDAIECKLLSDYDYFKKNY